MALPESEKEELRVARHHRGGRIHRQTVSSHFVFVRVRTRRRKLIDLDLPQRVNQLSHSLFTWKSSSSDPFVFVTQSDDHVPEVEDAMLAQCSERLQQDACKELFKDCTK